MRVVRFFVCALKPIFNSDEILEIPLRIYQMPCLWLFPFIWIDCSRMRFQMIECCKKYLYYILVVAVAMHILHCRSPFFSVGIQLEKLQTCGKIKIQLIECQQLRVYACACMMKRGIVNKRQSHGDSGGSSNTTGISFKFISLLLSVTCVGQWMHE